jgi:DNA polymerase III alpha subunit
MEMEVLGFAVSGHPLRMFDGAIAGLARKRRIVKAADIHLNAGRSVDAVGWKVSAGGARTSGSGEEMMFVTFSDPSGRFEAVFFPRAYARLARELAGRRGPFHIRGRVEEEFGAHTLTVDDIRVIGRPVASD